MKDTMTNRLGSRLDKFAGDHTGLFVLLLYAVTLAAVVIWLLVR